MQNTDTASWQASAGKILMTIVTILVCFSILLSLSHLFTGALTALFTWSDGDGSVERRAMGAFTSPLIYLLVAGPVTLTFLIRWATQKHLHKVPLAAVSLVFMLPFYVFMNSIYVSSQFNSDYWNHLPWQTQAKLILSDTALADHMKHVYE